MIIKPPRGAQLNKAHPLTRGLVGCWLFNEGTGDKVKDLSGNNNQGTLTNMDPATDWVGGNNGFALDFDGVDDYIATSSFMDTSGAITIIIKQFIATADVQASSAFGGYGLDPNADRLQAHLPYSDNTLYFDYGDYTTNGRISTDYTQRLDRWADIALVSDGKGGSWKAIYFNGILVASDIGASDGPDGNVTFDIGRALLTTILYTKAKISYIYVYNRVLSTSEVQQLYINRYQMFESGVSAGIFGTLGGIGLQGSLISQSKFNGDVNVLRSLAGDIVSASIFSGRFAGSVLLDGKIYTIADIQGSVARDVIFNGNVNEITQLAGALNRSINIAGNVDSEIDISGILKRNIPFVGNINSLSEISGMMVRTIEAAGDIKSQTNVNGMLIKNIGLDGQINELINIGGNLSFQNVLLLDGKIYLLVDITGTAIRDIIINGSIEEITQLSGAANRGINIAGDVDSLSDISGSLLRIIGASGNINAQAKLEADIIRNIGLQGNINEFIDTFGDLTLQGILLLNGKIYSLANLGGSAGINISLNSRINALNNFQGAVGILRPLSGDIDPTASLRADVAMVRGLDGNIISESIIEVDMSMNLALSAQVEAAINFVASAGIIIPIDGAIVISSIFSGGLASGVEIIVTADRRVFIKDTNRRIFMKDTNRRKFLIN